MNHQQKILINELTAKLSLTRKLIVSRRKSDQNIKYLKWDAKKDK